MSKANTQLEPVEQEVDKIVEKFTRSLSKHLVTLINRREKKLIKEYSKDAPKKPKKQQRKHASSRSESESE